MSNYDARRHSLQKSSKTHDSARLKKDSVTCSSQSQQFINFAREIGTDEAEERFDAALKKTRLIGRLWIARVASARPKPSEDVPADTTDYGKFPKVQILTIEDLFAGEKVDMPWADPTAFKNPAKEASPDTQGKLF